MRKNGIKKKIFAAAAAFALCASMATPAMASANYTAVNGGTCTFDKYLVTDEGIKIPNLEFAYAIAPGTAQTYNVDGHQMEVLAGLGTPTITWDAHGAANSTVKFAATDPVILTADKADTDFVKNLDAGEQYAKHTATVSFASVSFPEPGIYRYVITETASTAAGVTNDADLTRVLDVYVTDNNGALQVSSYVLHATETAPVEMNATNGSDGNTSTDATAGLPNGVAASDYKSQGFTNEYATVDLQLSKAVSGNQASKDKYFKFVVKIENATAGNIYPVSYANDNIASTTDGDADTTVGANAATLDAYEGATQPATLTVGADGTVEQAFYLNHGQKIAIRGLGKTVKYTITETQEDYKPAATATEGTVDTAGNKVTINSADVDNTVAFTNTRNGVIPTGIGVTVLPGIGLAALGSIGIALSKKKKRENA